MYDYDRGVWLEGEELEEAIDELIKEISQWLLHKDYPEDGD